MLTMAVSAALAARRTLVKLLLALASAYAIALVLTRDSTDAVVEAAYKKMSRKVLEGRSGSAPGLTKPFLQVAPKTSEDPPPRGLPRKSTYQVVQIGG